MVAAVVVLVTAASTLLGVAALLLDVTQDRAFSGEVERAQPEDVDVNAFLVDMLGSDLVSVREEARALVLDALASLDPTVTSVASSQIREFANGSRIGYLASGDALDRSADLTAGRWPVAAAGRGPLEAALPQSAATRLGLALGDRLVLGDEPGLEGVDGSVSVVLVGTFRPRSAAGWEGDRLSGAGYDPAYGDGSITAPAYGPFVVDDSALVASGSTVSSLRVTAHPTLRGVDDASLRSAVESLDDVSGLLTARVGDRVRITRVASELPTTFDRLHTQQAAARSTVLVVVVLGAMLSLVCLLLAGRLVAAVRDDERALLVGLGLSREQQLGTAAGEAALIAGVASLVSVPSASLVHSRITHLSAMRDAGLTQAPSVTAGLVATVLAGALLMTAALVLPALDLDQSGTPGRWRSTARSGIDVLLVALVVGAWWQLRAQRTTASTSGDLTLTVAPVVFLLGLVLVLTRGIPKLVGLVAGTGARSRGLVLPLAVMQAARRRQTGAATVLLASAMAASTFAIAFHATWERSQTDQADLRVGTDLTLALPAPATADDAAAVVAATAGDDDPAVSTVADRPLVLGRYVGSPGSAPVLVAVDSRQAQELLRGRLDGGSTWADVGDDLGPDDLVDGIDLPADGAGIELEAEAPAGITLSVTPTAVIQDGSGFRSAVAAEPVPVDGRSHRVQWQSRLSGQLVALRMQLSADPNASDSEVPDGTVTLALRVPGSRTSADGADGAGAPEWNAQPLDRQSPVLGVTVSVVEGATHTVVRTVAGVELTYLAYTGADLLVSAFTQPDVVPVAVSEELVDAVGTKVGGELSAIVGGVAVTLDVVAIVPDVPSAPGRVAVLADADTLSRTLVHAGLLEPAVDGWWVAHPSPRSVRALRALGLGEVTTRHDVAADLTRGPMRVMVPAALLMLVVAAGVLLLVGGGLVVGGDRRRQTAEVARLRALGLTGGEMRRLLLIEHGALLVPLVLVGAVVGAAAAWALGPYLVRSDTGTAPAPGVAVVWPWVGELAVAGGLLLGCFLIAGVVVVARVRRSDATQLRTGDS